MKKRKTEKEGKREISVFLQNHSQLFFGIQIRIDFFTKSLVVTYVFTRKSQIWLKKNFNFNLSWIANETRLFIMSYLHWGRGTLYHFIFVWFFAFGKRWCKLLLFPWSDLIVCFFHCFCYFSSWRSKCI